MSEFILHQQMLPAPELIEPMTGASVLIGELLHSAVKIVFDNQSTTSVVLSFSNDGGNTKIQWKTFVGEEALVLDNDLYTFMKGTQFYGNGAANGSFSISYTYINYP
jgi:hypothetical protein